MVKMVNFMLCIFYHKNEKLKKKTKVEKTPSISIQKFTVWFSLYPLPPPTVPLIVPCTSLFPIYKVIIYLQIAYNLACLPDPTMSSLQAVAQCLRPQALETEFTS